jgi:phospholipid N-methyltransferase
MIFRNEFFDHNTKNLGKITLANELEAMGYTPNGSAYPKYDKIFNILRDNNHQHLRVLDVGAGTGAMWHYLMHRLPGKVNKLDLVEPYRQYHSLLNDRVRNLTASGITTKSYAATIEEFKIFHPDKRYDVVILCGAVNYYPPHELRELILSAADFVRQGGLFIMESNIMTPITPVSPGVYNPSFDNLSIIFNERFSEYDIWMFGKYTSIWTAICELEIPVRVPEVNEAEVTIAETSSVEVKEEFREEEKEH